MEQFISSSHLFRELRDSNMLPIEVKIHSTTGQAIDLA